MALTQIRPFLYLGNQFSSTVANVDVIISLGCNSKCKHSVKTHKFSIKDNQESDLTDILTATTSLIDEYANADKTVLVHCKGGINRSPMVIIAYLCRYCQYEVNEAIEQVKLMRPSIRIQPHYYNQLVRWIENAI